MAKERPKGDLAALLRSSRKRAGLSQAEAADQAELSRPRLSHLESGVAHATLETAVRLGAVLGVSPEVIALAHVKDSLHGVAPDAVAALEAHIAGGALWAMTVRRQGLRIERGRFEVTVNGSGDATIVRHLSGCHASRERRKLTFRERIHGDTRPAFTVRESPRGLDYDVHLQTDGEWRLHEVEFHKPWMPGDGPFSFEVTATLPRAFVLDPKEDEARRVAHRMRRLEPPHGEWLLGVPYCFEQLEAVLRLPETYEPEWHSKPTAKWDSAPLDDDEGNFLDEPICRRVAFEAKGNQARLVLERPLVGMKFGIGWTPVRGWMASNEGD